MADMAIKLHSYQLLYAPAADLGLSTAELNKMHPKPLCLILFGESFIVRAMDPIIKIGEMSVSDFEIQSDQRSIYCYLYKYPAEDSEISIDYGRGIQAVSDKPFSIKQLNKDVRS